MICTKRHRGREGRLCQTDGTPCCVFDWKRKVTFAATSKRQWSAKQIGLRSAPLLEQTLLQGTSEVVFHNNAVCASQLSEVKGDVPLSSLQGEQKPLLRYPAMCSAKAAEKPRQWMQGFLFVCLVCIFSLLVISKLYSGTAQRVFHLVYQVSRSHSE